MTDSLGTPTIGERQEIAEVAPCPTCHQYSHSIGEGEIAKAFNHFQSMVAHPVRGHPMGYAFEERTRDAAQVLVSAILSLDSPSLGEGERGAVQHLRRRAEGFRAAALKQRERIGPLAKAFDLAADELATLATPTTNAPVVDLREAVDAEREACAKVAEEDWTPAYGPHKQVIEAIAEQQRTGIASRIRARQPLPIHGEMREALRSEIEEIAHKLRHGPMEHMLQARAANLIGHLWHLLSLTKTATNADMRGAWDWLAENRRLEVRHYAPVYGDDDDQGVEWRVTEVSGSINDREWTTVGRGATPLEAVLAARTVLQGDKS